MVPEPVFSTFPLFTTFPLLGRDLEQGLSAPPFEDLRLCLGVVHTPAS